MFSLKDDIKYMIVGYKEGKGYALKNMRDEMVVYISLKDLLELSKKERIYGVVDGKVDLDWFRQYYSKCVLCMDSDELRSKFGIVSVNGKFQVGSIDNCRFIEFIEVLDFTNGRLHNKLFSYTKAHNSDLFHVQNKSNEIGYLKSGEGLEHIDISNLLDAGATVCYMGVLVNAWDLKMKGITYSFNYCKTCHVVDIPEGSIVSLHYVQSKDSKLFIGKNCDLRRLVINKSVKPEYIYLEDMSMLDDVKAYYAFDSSYKFNSCRFDFINGTVVTSYKE